MKKKLLRKLLGGVQLVVRERIVIGRVTLGLAPVKREDGWYDPNTGEYGIYSAPKVIQVMNIL